MFSFIKNIFKGTLHKACEKGDIEAVKQHLPAGTDVNAKDGGGLTPLHNTYSEGHKAVAELLIAEGADVNEIGNLLNTPLDLAIIIKKTETADLLRKYGGHFPNNSGLRKHPKLCNIG